MSIFAPGFLLRQYPHIKRYRQIASVLLKHGFGDLVTTIGLHRHIGLGRRTVDGAKVRSPAHSPARSPARLTRWQRVRMAMEELGPSFVKLGQLAGTRPDMVPQGLCDELVKLQDTVPPFPFDQAREIVEADLGESLESLFDSFGETPVASGSMAQVHRAVLKTGRPVAVKVQRPDVHRIVEVDLEIMLDLAKLIERHFHRLDAINPVGIVEEFARTIRKEMDFDIEAGHIERFARNFASNQAIHVPEVLRQFSGEKVLTMEFIDGTKVSDIHALNDGGFDLEVIAGRGADLILEQIFEHGFFHADPHPGNIMILPGNVICFLDYGMMGTITGRYRECLSNLVVGIVRRDERQITSAFLGLSSNENHEVADRLHADVSDFVEQHFYRPLKDIHMGRMISQLVQLLIRHKLRIVPDFYLLTKALAMAESNGRMLSPGFDMVVHTEPFARKIVSRRFRAKAVMKDLYLSGIDMGELLRNLPADLRDIIAQVKRGRIHVEFEHKGLEPMLDRHDRISNRIVFAIVLAALVIGSSLIVLSGIPPKWRGIPFIGIAGFSVAGAMGFWLLVSILRHGKT